MRRPELILVLAAGCTPTPNAEVAALFEAISTGDGAAITQRVHPDYSDPLGDRAQLLADLAGIRERWPRVDVTLTELETIPNPPTVEVQGKLELVLAGTPGWKYVGALQLELVRATRWQVRSGLLADLRDIHTLMDGRHQALEGNDGARYATLLHPQYADGDIDLIEAKARIATDLEGVAIRHRPSHYRVEVRGPTAHVDERYELAIGDRTLPRSVARLTLRRAAGRWKIQAGLYPQERKK